jgi:CyaY protein
LAAGGQTENQNHAGQDPHLMGLKRKSREYSGCLFSGKPTRRILPVQGSIPRGKALQDSDFHELVDDIVMQLEDELEEFPEDIDVENAGGILTIGFPNRSAIVVSRQITNHEIWVAAKSGGFHLANKSDHWLCGTTGEDLPTLMSRVVSEQLERPINLLSD